MKGKIMMMIMILRMNIYQLLAHSMRKPIMMVRIVIFIMMMIMMIMMMMMVVILQTQPSRSCTLNKIPPLLMGSASSTPILLSELFHNHIIV